MKYDRIIQPAGEEIRSRRRAGARWVTGAHVAYGVRRGRFLQGRAVKHAFARPCRATGNICQLIAVWHDRCRKRRDLARLDDRLLRDIGVSQQAAKREINKPFWRE